MSITYIEVSFEYYYDLLNIRIYIGSIRWLDLAKRRYANKQQESYRYFFHIISRQDTFIIFNYCAVAYREINSAHSQSSGQLYNESLKSYNVKDFCHALKSVEKSIELNLPFDHVHYLRGVSKDHVQDFKGALADFEIQVKLSPQEAENYYSRGNARRELNDCRGALADLDTAITLNPNAPTYWTVRGISKFALKQYPEAAKDMQ